MAQALTAAWYRREYEAGRLDAADVPNEFLDEFLGPDTQPPVDMSRAIQREIPEA